ncbi:hypothetical protein [Alteromonas oceanisediminis]|uniref:hypothetical protein n=1 Tax=Alteromonas oceanisediminis TaxID=2836180 RepID=UPI001BDAD849|nr:hypothetical protein [Alteromonas oceanisediminis]MBT0586669.1 hypothetical protein [Alteromonas oceanisediminis]
MLLLKRRTASSLWLFSRTAVALLTVFLAGCTTTGGLPSIIAEKQAPVDVSSLYLRGVFNWWEAEPAYRLTKDYRGGYSVTIELIADGQPYDFKVADADWTPANSCGSQDIVEIITLTSTHSLYCGAETANLQFTPQSTGWYTFWVEPTQSGAITLNVSRR